jgi:hypothetical protein
MLAANGRPSGFDPKFDAMGGRRFPSAELTGSKSSGSSWSESSASRSFRKQPNAKFKREIKREILKLEASEDDMAQILADA